MDGEIAYTLTWEQRHLIQSLLIKASVHDEQHEELYDEGLEMLRELDPHFI